MEQQTLLLDLVLADEEVKVFISNNNGSQLLTTRQQEEVYCQNSV